MKDKPVVTAKRIDTDFPLDDQEAWQASVPVVTDRYWSGEIAPHSRKFETSLLWSENFLYIRFVCEQREPLVISEHPDPTRKSMDLFERDACEIFIAPNKIEPSRYFEFEVAPTGEWLDLEIHQGPEQRVTDWDYSSGLEAWPKIGDGTVEMSLKIPFDAFNARPAPGEVWAANIYRLVGKGETRGYLAWSPTLTNGPNFHVPERFGLLKFTGS